METNFFFKYRSITACMKEAYNLISDQLKPLLKATWWAVGIYAIFMAITIYFRLPNKQLHDWGLSNPWASYIVQTLIYLATWLTSFLTGASLWKWLNNKPLLYNLWRLGLLTILADVFVGIIITIYPIATASLPLVWNIIVGFCLLVVAIIVYLPFANITPAWLLYVGADFHPWQSYKQGLRHLGSILLLGFLSLLIIAILSGFILAPAMVLTGAQLSSQLGALNGDSLGVPIYFTPLLIFILVLSVFILFYVVSWMLLALVYLYGSNTEKDKKRKEA